MRPGRSPGSSWTPSTTPGTSPKMTPLMEMREIHWINQARLCVKNVKCNKIRTSKKKKNSQRKVKPIVNHLLEVSQKIKSFPTDLPTEIIDIIRTDSLPRNPSPNFTYHPIGGGNLQRSIIQPSTLLWKPECTQKTITVKIIHSLN
jgi:hypothetical protein